MIEGIFYLLGCVFICILMLWFWYDNHKWVVEMNGTRFYFKTKEKAEEFVMRNRELWEMHVKIIEKLDELERKIKESEE